MIEVPLTTVDKLVEGHYQAEPHWNMKAEQRGKNQRHRYHRNSGRQAQPQLTIQPKTVQHHQPAQVRTKIMKDQNYAI